MTGPGKRGDTKVRWQHTGVGQSGHERWSSAFCVHCHAWRGELGQEPTIELYVEHLVAVFRAVRRVLRPDGTLWVNLAGCYYNDPGGQNGGVGNTLDYGAGRVSPKVTEANRQNGRQKRGRHPWLKPLDWVDVPGLFARAMQQDGWTWRSDVVWVKPSALPESVSGTRWERCRVLAQGQEKRGAQVGAINGYVDGEASKSLDLLEPAKWADCPGCPKCAATDGLVLRRGSGRPTKATERVLLFTRGPGYYFDQEAVRETLLHPDRSGTNPIHPELTLANGRDRGRAYDGWERPIESNPAGRNLRDWWVISPEPLKDAHYAAYPSALPERCIKAGTSEWGCCPSCGAPWARVVSRSVHFEGGSGRAGNTPDGKWAGTEQAISGDYDIRKGPVVESSTLGWRPTCACGKDQAPVPARVLDCFGGSGTTALAANRLGRDCTLVELKPRVRRAGPEAGRAGAALPVRLEARGHPRGHPRGGTGMSWRTWGMGFIAGSVLASYITLTCGTGTAQSAEVASAIHQAATEYGVSERWMLRIARCESSYLPWVTSRGGHRGLFQFSDRTWWWMSHQAGHGGTSPYDPWSAAMVTAWALSRGMSGHWSCR